MLALMADHMLLHKLCTDLRRDDQRQSLSAICTIFYCRDYNITKRIGKSVKR
jgi:hypothetical protein